MDNIIEYLNRTKSAVSKLFEAYNSYWELLNRDDDRLYFYCSGDIHSEKNKVAYEKWRIENKEVIEADLRRQNEFAYETFARSALMGTVLQFVFWAIDKFSTNTFITPDFVDEIKPQTKTQKFCIGRLIDEIPIGLIIYAGRNQAVHFDDEKPHTITKKVFHKLANWYSPTFQKWFVNNAYDLENPNILNYAEIITYKLGWTNYKTYESDMLDILKSS